MNKTVILLTLVLTFSISVFGQIKPDYTGAWTLNLRRSTVFQGMPFPAVTKLIKQSDKEIEDLNDLMIPVAVPENKPQSIIYPFDWNENLKEIKTSTGKTSFFIKCGFNKENDFEFVERQKVKINSKEIETTKTETWKVESSGKILKIQTTYSTPDGDRVSEIIYEKDNTADILNPMRQLNTIGVANAVPSQRIKPIYPAEAKKIKADGLVYVLILFDEKGNVILAKAISGHPTLLTVSETAARFSKFSPITGQIAPFKETGIIVYMFEKQ